MKNNTINVNQDTQPSEFNKLAQTPEDIDTRISQRVQHTVAFGFFNGLAASFSFPKASAGIHRVERLSDGEYKLYFDKPRRDNVYTVIAMSADRLYSSISTRTNYNFIITTENNGGVLTDSTEVHFIVLDNKL